MLKKLTTYLLISMLVSSCQEDLSNEQQSPASLQSAKSGTVVNGRFYFSSKEDLKRTMADYKLMSEIQLEKKFSKLYLGGFRSHTPIVNPKDENLITLLDNEHKNSLGIYSKSNTQGTTEAPIENPVESPGFLEAAEEEASIIADPILGLVINEDNEIIINDSIYKITADLGVLSARVQDSTYLYNYIALNSSPSIVGKKSKTGKSAVEIGPGPEIPIEPGLPLMTPAKPPCELREAIGGRIDVDDHVTRFIAPFDPVDCASTPIYSTPPSKPYVPQLSPDQILQNRINSLAECQPERTSWFQSLFGTNISCINYFDSKHRIKNEFWNQNWGFYSSVGIQTRVQVKKLYVWWASDADELHLGINRVYMKYNYPAPVINYLNTFYSDPEVPVYMYKGEFTVRDYNGTLKNAPFITANSGLPFFDFGGDVLNIYLRKLPFGDKINIKSESNIKELYKLGINFLQSTINSNNGKKEFVISYQKTPTEIEVLYFGERYQKNNSNYIKRTFYDDTEFVVSVAYNSTPYNPDSSTPYGDWKYKIKKPDVSNQRKYTYFELDIFGMGRKGSTWAGSRMIKY